MTETRKTYAQLVADCEGKIQEMFPWDLEERMEKGDDLLLVDLRETHEYDTMHIDGAINVPRGILEAASEWNYEETEPELVTARDRTLVLICRSGHRSIMAAHVMQVLGFKDVWSLKTGMRGWNDYELPMVDLSGEPVDVEDGDAYFANKLLDFQRAPS